MQLNTPHTRKLPPVTAAVDTALIDIDQRIDWLFYLSPQQNDEQWQWFQQSGYTQEPKLTYPKIPDDYLHLRDELRKLPMDDVEDSMFHALLLEKQSELELQLELVLMRNSEGFASISVDLFGGAEPDLLSCAKNILQALPSDTEQVYIANCDEFCAAAESELDFYRTQAPNFDAEVHILDDLNSQMMVHQGHLKVARSLKIPPQRIHALIAHEIGTHIVTRYNGLHQPLKQLEVGLAHYDPLQEGMGILAEYIAGFLPTQRLRVIAARVVAVELVLKRFGICEIFHALHDDCELCPEDAFDVAVRAYRGGGLTKDSVYLRGLRDLLVYLKDGNDYDFLHIGKFSLQQVPHLKELYQKGWLIKPQLLPRHLQTPQGKAALEKVRTLHIESLFHLESEV